MNSNNFQALMEIHYINNQLIILIIRRPLQASSVLDYVRVNNLSTINHSPILCPPIKHPPLPHFPASRTLNTSTIKRSAVHPSHLSARTSDSAPSSLSGLQDPMPAVFRIGPWVSLQSPLALWPASSCRDLRICSQQPPRPPGSVACSL